MQAIDQFNRREKFDAGKFGHRADSQAIDPANNQTGLGRSHSRGPAPADVSDPFALMRYWYTLPAVKAVA